MSAPAADPQDARDARDLQRFIDAQAPVIAAVQAELDAGAKTSHWMWFVFPQLAALGRSATAKHYGLSGAAAARAYLAHPLLGTRLVDCSERVLRAASRGRSALQIFGAIDAIKLRSCLTLFERAVPDEPLFGQLLRQYCSGERDATTLQMLGDDRSR